MNDEAGFPTLEQLATLSRYQPIFTDPGFVCGEWREPEPRNGVGVFPWFVYNEQIRQFIKDVERTGWMLNFDWGEWVRGPEAQALIRNAHALERANADQIRRLLTACVRHERFCDGSLAASFESGLLTNIVRRASVLLNERS